MKLSTVGTTFYEEPDFPIMKITARTLSSTKPSAFITDRQTETITTRSPHSHLSNISKLVLMQIEHQTFSPPKNR